MFGNDKGQIFLHLHLGSEERAFKFLKESYHKDPIMGDSHFLIDLSKNSGWKISYLQIPQQLRALDNSFRSIFAKKIGLYLDPRELTPATDYCNAMGYLEQRIPRRVLLYEFFQNGMVIYWARDRYGEEKDDRDPNEALILAHPASSQIASAFSEGRTIQEILERLEIQKVQPQGLYDVVIKPRVKLTNSLQRVRVSEIKR